MIAFLDARGNELNDIIANDHFVWLETATVEFIEQTTFSIASRLKLLRPDMNLDNDDLFLLDSMAEPLVKSWL